MIFRLFTNFSLSFCLFIAVLNEVIGTLLNSVELKEGGDPSSKVSKRVSFMIGENRDEGKGGAAS